MAEVEKDFDLENHGDCRDEVGDPDMVDIADHLVTELSRRKPYSVSARRIPDSVLEEFGDLFEHRGSDGQGEDLSGVSVPLSIGKPGFLYVKKGQNTGGRCCVTGDCLGCDMHEFNPDYVEIRSALEFGGYSEEAISAFFACLETNFGEVASAEARIVCDLARREYFPKQIFTALRDFRARSRNHPDASKWFHQTPVILRMKTRRQLDMAVPPNVVQKVNAVQLLAYVDDNSDGGDFDPNQLY